MRRRMIPFLVLGLVAGFAAPAAAQVDVSCKPQRPTADRSSAYDSTAIVIGGKRALICYGRPAARGRTMIGGTAVPYGKLWRTGANEPTTLHIPFAATIAGVKVEPGSYSIYTIPGEKEWTIIFNKQTGQWGVKRGGATSREEAQDALTVKVKPKRSSALTERLSYDVTDKGFTLRWENTEVPVSIKM